jgi:hypothetical protein
LVPLFWAPYRDPLKIKETGRELASWPKLNKTHTTTNRKTTIAVEGMLERGHTGVGACEETSSHCLGDDWDNKKIK